MSENLSINARLLKHIADALGTAETGPVLIEVARNAHRAEQREAQFLNYAQNGDYSVETAYQKVYGDWKDEPSKT